MMNGARASRSILHSGIHKSGNFWLSLILRRINHHAGVGHRSWIQRQPIHAPRSMEVLPLFDKIVYLIREPRDIAVSLSRFVFTSHVQRNWVAQPGSSERSPV
jgi:hypothetical protein